MRIIAGEARGRKLAAPEGLDTRPTLDRVRESLFSIIQFEVYGAKFLDMFAGSGAIGLEALSRGAAFCAFVDKNAQSSTCILKNIDTLDYSGKSLLRRSDFFDAAAAFSRLKLSFDIVYLDPPYKGTLILEATRVLLKHALLSDGAIVVAEHKRHDEPQVDAGLTLYDKRGYGDVGLSFYKRSESV